MNIEAGFIQKILTFLQGLFKGHIRFSSTSYQEYSQIVQKCT